MPLTQEELTIVEHILIEDEGLRSFPYRDTVGKLTIGVGRNLDDVGLSDDECMYLLHNDIKSVTDSLDRSFQWFKTLNTPRRIVLVSMAFNLGIEGLKGFKKMLALVQCKDFNGASKQMLQSKWATQVGDRANRLAGIMNSGQF